MRALVQTFLIGGGILGFLLTVVPGYIGWRFHRGFGGDLTLNDRLMIWSPVVCIGTVILGFAWRRLTERSRTQSPESTDNANPNA